MSTGLGVVVGSVNSVAAVDTDRATELDGSSHVIVTHRSTLQLSADDAPVLGVDRQTAAAGRHSKNVLLDGFVGRVGDPVGILADDGSIYRGEDLTATAIGCLIDEASRGLQDQPTVVTTYPASWPHYTVDALRDALERAGFGDVTPVPEPAAALRWLETTRGPLDDGAVVVYDLGGTKLDISVVRTGETTGILGQPLHSDDISGAAFDHLTMQHVLANAVDVASIDPFDPATEQALAELRARAAVAKEALSTDTETAITVELPGVHTDVRLVRDELEDLLREPLTASIELVNEAVRVAGLELGDVSRVLLVGGGASIPLVAELISSTLGLPVVASPAPDQTTALGAAMLARELAGASAALAEPIAAAAVPNSLAATVSKSPAVRPAPALPVAAAAATKEGMPRWKKLAIVGASVAGIMVATAGGLSLGTGAFTNSPKESGTTQSPSAEVSTTVAPAASTGAQPSDATAPGAGGDAATTSQPGAGGSTQSNNSGGSQTQAPAQRSEANSQPTQQNPAPQSPAAESPAPVNPNPGSGNSGQTNPPPVVVPEPVPGPNTPYVPDDDYNGLPGLPSIPQPNIQPNIPIVPTSIPIVGGL